MEKYIVTIELLIEAQDYDAAEEKAKDLLLWETGPGAVFDCQDYPKHNEQEGSFEIVDSVTLADFYDGKTDKW